MHIFTQLPKNIILQNHNKETHLINISRINPQGKLRRYIYLITHESDLCQCEYKYLCQNIFRDVIRLEANMLCFQHLIII